MSENASHRPKSSPITRWIRFFIVLFVLGEYFFESPHESIINDILCYSLFITLMLIQLFFRSNAHSSRVLHELLIENLLITTLVALNPLNTKISLLYVNIIYRCGRSFSITKGILAMLVTLCFEISGACLWGSFVHLGHQQFLEILSILLSDLPAWPLVFATGRMFRSQMKAWEQTHLLLEENRKQQVELEQAYKEVLTYAMKAEEVATLRERNRLAGEIHDTVGHALTSVIRGTDACVELIKNKNYDLLLRYLTSMREIAKESLEDIRKSVKTLSSPATWNQDWDVVLTRFAQRVFETTGTEVKVMGKGYLDIPKEDRHIVYQCIKEAVTNAIRHGKSSKIEIKSIQSPGSVTIQITDNGIGTPVVKPGFGLNGIKAKIQKIGGRASFYSQPGNGFKVELTLTKKGGERSHEPEIQNSHMR